MKVKFTLLGVLIITLTLSNLSFSCTEKSTSCNEEPSQEVSMEVKIMTAKETFIPEKIVGELKEATEQVIKTHLTTDYTQSGRIIAETSILSISENIYHCESIVTFLYKQTFTAVIVRIEFDYIPAQIKGVKIQRNYVPGPGEGF